MILRSLLLLLFFSACALAQQAETLVYDAFSGGINRTGGPKTNYSVLWLKQTAQTLGQVNALSFTSFHYSNGDTVGLDGFAQSWGRNNAGGDEGTEAITAAAFQGDRVMTATVSAVDSGVISYISSVNEDTRGEARPIIITTPAKVYSAGTIIAVSGTPPAVTGDGAQDFTTLGVGFVSNLFLSIDSQANGALKLVVPVRSVTDATHLVLDYVSEGVDASLPAPMLPSTYKIFKGGNVTSLVSPSGALTVASAGDFSIGDTIEQPLGYAHTIKGIHVAVSQQLPFSSNANGAGLVVANIGPQPFANAGVFSGAFVQGFEFTGVMTNGIRFDKDMTGALLRSNAFTPGAITNLLGLFDSTGHDTYLSYDRLADVWKTTKPISAPAFQAPAGPGVDCVGPPTSNYHVSKGIVVAC